MNNFILISYLLAIVISIASLITTLLFVIPLQFKMLRVKNGLAKLRQKQLLKGGLSLIMSVSTIAILVIRFYLPLDLRGYPTAFLIVLFAFAWFLKQLIESSIYHTQFTVDQILLHDKIDKEEKKQEKIEAKNK